MSIPIGSFSSLQLIEATIENTLTDYKHAVAFTHINTSVLCSSFLSFSFLLLLNNFHDSNVFFLCVLLFIVRTNDCTND